MCLCTGIAFAQDEVFGFSSIYLFLVVIWITVQWFDVEFVCRNARSCHLGPSSRWTARDWSPSGLQHICIERLSVRSPIIASVHNYISVDLNRVG